jgi:hypothetical protein
MFARHTGWRRDEDLDRPGAPWLVDRLEEIVTEGSAERRFELLAVDESRAPNRDAHSLASRRCRTEELRRVLVLTGCRTAGGKGLEKIVHNEARVARLEEPESALRRLPRSGNLSRGELGISEVREGHRHRQLVPDLLGGAEGALEDVTSTVVASEDRP